MAADHRSDPHADRDTGTHDGVLIAETGETGDVTWVWVLHAGERIARPFHRRDRGLPLDRFKPVGARRDEIASWIGSAALG